MQTGQLLKLDDLLVPGYQEKLLPLVEQKLRQNYNIRADQSLSEFGFSFPEAKFYLSDNFYLKPEGLGFFYNVYEIAPYAVGFQDIFIPYEEIQSLIKKNGLLAAELNQRD
ncbi:MAG: DUF3298 domain-containing protein [Bacteroidia bacterium]|nr:DUF3298 domain-containing protein [Bacteroidia bacterium]